MDNPFDAKTLSNLKADCDKLAKAAGRHAKSSPTTIDDYRQMLRIRKVEEALQQLHRDGKIPGSMHLAIGQEAVAVGAVGSLKKTDHLTATYRGHHHSIAKGVRPMALMAEILGREAGTSRGRGGSMLSFDSKVGLLGTSGIVGGAVPLAVGAALTADRLKTGAVAMTVFGDGAVAQGTVHEAINIAALWRLPVVFVCENNCYSELTPTEATTAVQPLAIRALAHGVPSLTVDGNCVDQVRGATLAALERARAGQGPSFVEAMTYRLCGHYVGDPEVYRTSREVEARRSSDPIALAAKALRDGGVDQRQLTEVEESVNKEVEEARQLALDSPPPAAQGMFEHVVARV